MTKYFVALMILGYFLADVHGSQPAECCTACDNISAKKAIAGLWSIPDKLTPLSRNLKKAVLAQLSSCIDGQLPYLVAMSLWTVDMFTEFTPDLTPAVVYQDLIKASVEVTKVPRNISGIDRAVLEFGKLCLLAIDYTIQVGLRAAGCPNTRMNNTIPPTVIQPSFQQFIDMNGDQIPRGIRKAIVKLSKSSYDVDRRVATAAVASMTDSSIAYFKYILDSGSLMKTVKFKGCSIPIPRNCCNEREAVLKQRTEDLSQYTWEKICVMRHH